MKKAAFSLIEDIISLTILAVITIISFSIFRITSSAWERDTELILEIQEARSFLEMMHRDISSAFLEETDDIFFLGDENKLFFIALEVIDTEVSDLVEVGYVKENSFIYKHFQLEPDFNFLTLDSKEEVCQNVILFDLSYYNGQEWVKDWDSSLIGELPQSVKVLLKTLVNDKENTYQAVVYIPSSGN